MYLSRDVVPRARALSRRGFICDVRSQVHDRAAAWKLLVDYQEAIQTHSALASAAQIVPSESQYSVSNPRPPRTTLQFQDGSSWFQAETQAQGSFAKVCDVCA